MNANNYSATINNAVTNPTEALWVLFKSQPKAVRKALTWRILSEDTEAQAIQRKLAVKQSVSQAFAELAEAEEMIIVLPDARNLFI